MIRAAFTALLALAAAPLAAQQPAPGPTAPDYAQDSAWLCLPGRADACSRPQPTADLDPAGYGPVIESRPAADPGIDCFYVYPTVSRDPGPNSDLNAGAEENAAAAVQFARFSTVCRPFAPIYRQITVPRLQQALFAGLTEADLAGEFEQAYGDVVAAWRHYLANHNRGRPFVLIGHSQGTIHLTRLVAGEIEGRPAAARMLSALLIGYNFEVPQGRDVGGTLLSTPLCTRLGQTGCVVTYVSFRASSPPPEAAQFGRVAAPGRTVACTNPATLASGEAPLDSYWYAAPSVTSAPSAITWSRAGPPPAPFLRTRGLVSARCVSEGNVGYLAVTVNADPADARTDAIPGDVAVAGVPLPGWGLHLVDVNIAQGDLVRLVEAQSAAYRRRRR